MKAASWFRSRSGSRRHTGAGDLGSAYLGGRGDGLGILLGHGARAIDEWTRQALERKPSIALDPPKALVMLTVIITRPITL